MHLTARVWRRPLALPRGSQCCIRAAVLCLAALWVFLSPVLAHAEKSDAPRFAHLVTEDGLSHNLVHAIMQDQRGFMWFGTQDGLNRYDGYDFTLYRHRRSAPDSLSDNPVLALLEDSSGKIWVGTTSGLDSFDGDADRFTHHPAITEQVSSLREGRDGALWIGTSGAGLYRLDRKTGELRQYRHEPNAPSTLGDGDVTAIYEDSGGTLWVGTSEGGLTALDPATGTATRYEHQDGAPESLSYNRVTAICEDRAGVLWVGTGSQFDDQVGGLNALDRSTGRFTRYLFRPGDPRTLSHNRVTAIYQSRSGALWVGTGNGLTVKAPGGESFRRYQHDPLDPRSLGGTAIITIAEDRSGVLWFGSDDRGISKYAPAKDRFRRYRPDLPEPDRLRSGRIGSVLEDRAGALWIGYFEGGLDRLDPESGQIRHYRHDDADPDSLGQDDVRAIYEDRQGILWIGTNGGLDSLDRSKNRFTHYVHDPSDPTSLGPGRVRAILQDRVGAIWVGMLEPGGLSRFDPSTRKFTRFQNDPADPKSFIETYGVTALYEDREGELWVATYDGLVRLTVAGKAISHYRHNSDDPTSLSHDFTWSICEDSQGNLWVGTDGGINRLDRSSEEAAVFGVDQGLATDQVKAVLSDDEGYLWLATDGGGVSRFDPDAKSFRNYDMADGIAGQEAIVGAYNRGASGRMYFGTRTGLTAFRPDQVKDNPHVPSVVLTAFRKFDSRVTFDRPLGEVSNIQLTHQDNFFAFEFAALDYTDPAKNLYSYQLEGFDRDWVQSGSRRYASYTNVPPGAYTFWVKGSNNDGIWNENGRSIRIVITPPFWETWWFRTLVAVLLVGAVGLVVGLRERYVARLRASEEYFRALFENSPLCVCELDMAHQPPQIRGGNLRVEQIYGYPVAEILGADLGILFAGHAGASAADVLRRAAPGQTLTIESCGLRKDGGEFPIRLSATRAGAGDGRLMILAIEDITAERERHSEEEAIDEERRRIARDIHDGLAQDMAGLRLKVGQWRLLVDSDPARMHSELDSFQQLLTKNLREIRRSIFALRPLPLAELGFYPALRQFVAEFGEQSQLRIDLRVVGPEDSLPTYLEPVLFRIIQEAVNNVGKHARAAMAWITIDLTQPNAIQLSVRDDGTGFDPVQLERGPASGHLGLVQMRERVAELHGDFQIRTRPGAGTTIEVSLPVRGEAPWPRSAS